MFDIGTLFRFRYGQQKTYIMVNPETDEAFSLSEGLIVPVIGLSWQFEVL